jgi:hypothetical protein
MAKYCVGAVRIALSVLPAFLMALFPVIKVTHNLIGGSLLMN